MPAIRDIKPKVPFYPHFDAVQRYEFILMKNSWNNYRKVPVYVLKRDEAGVLSYHPTDRTYRFDNLYQTGLEIIIEKVS